MTWTRLFYVKNLQKAFERFRPGAIRQQLPISKRYQYQIQKQFRLNGVPWIYNLEEAKMNPRDKRPKMKKRQIQKPIRIAKIEKALKQNETKQLEYRQERLNNRKLKGSDEMLAKSLPSFIKSDLSQIPDYMKKSRKEQDD